MAEADTQFTPSLHYHAGTSRKVGRFSPGSKEGAFGQSSEEGLVVKSKLRDCRRHRLISASGIEVGRLRHASWIGSRSPAPEGDRTNPVEPRTELASLRLSSPEAKIQISSRPHHHEELPRHGYRQSTNGTRGQSGPRPSARKRQDRRSRQDIRAGRRDRDNASLERELAYQLMRQPTRKRSKLP